MDEGVCVLYILNDLNQTAIKSKIGKNNDSENKARGEDF